MSLRKIADLPPSPCRHPEHAPPAASSLGPGLYEHACPGCGATSVFRADQPRLEAPAPKLEPAWRRCERDGGDCQRLRPCPVHEGRLDSGWIDGYNG